MSRSRPNFLVVMTDQQRADSVSLDPAGWTPHLASFARDAVNLSQTYCPSPHCCPSRATFFTSLYPSRHGVWNNILNQHALTRGPRPGVKQWSTALATAGYDLHFSGKWHVDAESNPEDHGWTEHHTSAAHGQDHHGPKWEFYENLAREANSPRPRPPGLIRRPVYGDQRIYETLPSGCKMVHDEDALTGALRALDQVKDGDKPWMLYAGFIGPHDPFAVPPEWLAKIPDSACELPLSYADTLRDKPVIYQRLREQLWDQLTPDEVREARRHYLAYCAYTDHLFGRLLARLDAIGARENTVVVFLSDHGDYAGDHGLFCKGIAGFRAAYHVPCFVRWPAGRLAAGTMGAALVSLADFGPTFLELAGLAAPPAGFTGRSLVPLLRGATPADWRDALTTQCNGVELAYTQRIVFTKEWKYIYNGFDRDELYDLVNDPHEMTNLAARPEHRDVVRAMCRRLWKFARAEGDELLSNYFTIGLAPFGPAEAFRD
jgi:arylsulfatase A-like enzyme